MSEMHATHIHARRGWRPPDVRELWAYRELLIVLAGRDVRVRYKQTVLGVSWAVVQPVLVMVVFSVVFGRLTRMPSDGIPYPLFSLAGLVPWTFFAGALTQASMSVVESGPLISKVYLPRLLVPAASVVSAAVDFVAAFAVLLVVLLYFGRVPGLSALAVPVLCLIAAAASLGASFWLSALNVRFRDVRYAIPFVLQLWLFCSPVVYPSAVLSSRWRVAYAVNPMVGVIEGFRWALAGAPTAPGRQILVSGIVAAALLVTGTMYFKRVEATFADLI